MMGSQGNGWSGKDICFHLKSRVSEIKFRVSRVVGLDSKPTNARRDSIYEISTVRGIQQKDFCGGPDPRICSVDCSHIHGGGVAKFRAQ